MMSKIEESEWERTFTYNNMRKYTAAQLQAEIDNARAFCKEHKYFE